MQQDVLIEHATALFAILEDFGGDAMVLMPCDNLTDEPLAGLFVVSGEKAKLISEFLTSIQSPTSRRVGGRFVENTDGTVRRINDEGGDA